jgi:hypothetical protein
MSRACLLLLVAVSACSKSTHPAKEPRLGVLVIFDQLRAIDLERLRDVFGATGFGGLEGRGAARYDAHYSYAETETGPGHATLATGSNPSVHGIISNYWFADGEMIYAISDKTAPVLGGPSDATNKGASAKHLRAGTLGDAMKAESAGKARVVTVSLKDRSAILSGGLSADLAIWYDVAQGKFTSSRAYGDALPDWLSKLANALPERSMAEGTWSPLPAPLGITLPEDASPNEAAEAAWADRFPHDLKSVAKAEDKRLAYRASPQSMHDTFAIARAALHEPSLALGEDDVADLLVISISTTDYTSHGYGPLSLEVFDLLRRADAELRDLSAELDRKLSPKGYVLAISSDHASTPLPELVQKAGVDAGRIPATQMKERIDEALQQLLASKHPGRTPVDKQPQPQPMPAPKAAPTGQEPQKPHVIAKDSTQKRPTYRFLKGFAPPHVYLDLSAFDEALRPQAIAAARAVIEATPGIATTYTPDELRRGDPDAFAPAFREALFDDRTGHAQRHGVILVRQKARYVYAFDDEVVGTDHGTPYSFDAFVPFIVMAPGVRSGRYAQPCDVRDVAPTLAFLLHGPRPDAAQGRAVSAVGDDQIP